MEDKKHYFLKVAALGRHPIMEISEHDYAEIVEAKRILSIALAVEEKYDLALCNFLEFEKELLTLTADYMTSMDLDYTKNYLVRSNLNRKIINFLSSGKMYTEQIASHVSKCTSNPEETINLITTMTNKRYDECIDYRTMDALRHHVSHSGFAVHTVSVPTHWTKDDNDERSELVFSIDIYAEKKILAENRKFKRSILNELPDRFDLKKGARSYIGAISSLQVEIRKIIGAIVNNARSTIEKHLDSYKKINNGNSFAVGAYDTKLPYQNTEHKEPVMLFLQWDDVRVGLEKKNRSISNMKKRYVTNALSSK